MVNGSFITMEVVSVSEDDHWTHGTMVVKCIRVWPKSRWRVNLRLCHIMPIPTPCLKLWYNTRPFRVLRLIVRLYTHTHAMLSRRRSLILGEKPRELLRSGKPEDATTGMANMYKYHKLATSKHSTIAAVNLSAKTLTTRKIYWLHCFSQTSLQNACIHLDLPFFHLFGFRRYVNNLRVLHISNNM